jgi:hypothetical protein
VDFRPPPSASKDTEPIVIGGRIRDLALFFAGSAFAILIHIVDPQETTSFPVCPFFAMTGLYCPGCGTLRCLHALLNADLRSAVDHNVLTVLLLPTVLVAWLSVGFSGIRGRPPPQPWSAPRWIGWVVAGALGLFWILRNVPLAPFAWMAP